MHAHLRSRLTYANVVSTLCLFILLGGSAYAAAVLPNNSVGSKQLKTGAVTTSKLHKGAVTTSTLRNGAVTGSKVANNSLTGAQINVSTLSEVPSARNADNATNAGNATNAQLLGGALPSAYAKAPVGPREFGTIPAARVTQGTRTAIPNNTLTTLDLPTTVYDNDQMHSTTANASRLTAPVTGVYQISAEVVWDGLASGDRALDIVTSNGFSDASQVPGEQTLLADPKAMTTEVQLNAGDFAELDVLQTSGGSLDVAGSLEMHWLGP